MGARGRRRGKLHLSGEVAMDGCLRMKSAAALVMATVAMLLCTSPAFAWGPLGHRIVARLAETRLTPQARTEAQKLLALRGARHLDDVAVWADDLRDTDPEMFQRTKRLHFVNFHSSDCIYDPPRDCRDGQCAVAAIDKYSAILANRSSSPAARVEALAFVVHFIGDIHQPLHADYRDDAGGNLFQVRWHGHGSNLHRIWDSTMLDSVHLSAAQYAHKLSLQNSPVATGGTPVDWAGESCRIDRDDGVYPSSRTIGQAYVQHELPIAERRLRQAGARLAALLNRDLGSG